MNLNRLNAKIATLQRELDRYLSAREVLMELNGHSTSKARALDAAAAALGMGNGNGERPKARATANHDALPPALLPWLGPLTVDQKRRRCLAVIDALTQANQDATKDTIGAVYAAAGWTITGQTLGSLRRTKQGVEKKGRWSLTPRGRQDLAAVAPTPPLSDEETGDDEASAEA